MIAELALLRKAVVADLIKDNQDKAFVEEKGREVLTMRRVGSEVMVSGIGRDTGNSNFHLVLVDGWWKTL